MIKKLFSFLVSFALFTVVNGQRSDLSFRPEPPSPFKYVPGWVNMTDVTYGIGLSETNDPNNPTDKSFISLTSSLNYHVNRNFSTGGGTGIMFNEEMFFVPLFLNGRYYFSMPGGYFIPYINVDAGFLLNFKNFNDQTRLFVSPLAGVRYVISSYVSATGGLGLLTHMGPNCPRSSFLTLKLGIFVTLNKK